MEEWDLFDDTDRSPAANMAMDEALLLTAASRSRALLRLYGWDRPAVSIGYVQAYSAAPAQGYAVVRRPTGGGVVFHDRDVTYSVVIPPQHRLARLDRMACYHEVNRAVQEGLTALGVRAALARREIAPGVDRATMVCFQHPTRYDVLTGGRKVAGSAQRRTRDGILHQGSVLLGDDSAVTAAQLRAGLVDGFAAGGVTFSPLVASADLLAQMGRLEAERYSRDEWNRRR